MFLAVPSVVEELEGSPLGALRALTRKLAVLEEVASRTSSLLFAAVLLSLLLTGCRYQTYWYCWDNPNRGAPHHLGHRVAGDHYCSQAELRDAGLE